MTTTQDTLQDTGTADAAAPTGGITRRDFLVRSLAGGGFMIGFGVPGLGALAEAQAAGGAGVTAWITIGADESVLLYVPITEMGQGTMTGLAQIMADELRVDFARIRVEHAPVDAAHGGTNASPWGRFTGGSTGIRLFSPGLKQAAANARQMLITAAAGQWGVAPASCTANLGVVSATVGGALRTATYGALAPVAGGIVLTANAPLGAYPSMYVGTSPRRVDLPAKVTGAAKFGIDIWEAGMLFAAVKHCPTLGGTVAGIGSKPAGAQAVVAIGQIGQPGQPGYRAANGVAAVAATTWDALRAVAGTSVTWAPPADAAANDSAAIAARAAALMSSGAGIVADQANADQLAAGMAAGRTINSTYDLPFLAHASMEPLNCTVRFTPATGGAAAKLEMWAPTQAPDLARATAAGLCPAGTVVVVVNTLVGTGFGRKFEQDFIREAVQVGLAVPGKLVKLMWSREEDFAYDMFRPMAKINVQAAVSPATGRITAWRYRTVTPSIGFQRGAAATALDGSAVEGAVHLPYALSPRYVDYVRHDATIPVGYWRSVGLSLNTFAVESAIDELATAIGADPVQFRLNNLADARMVTLLTALKGLGNWGTPGASNRAQGVAIAAGFGSYVGQIAEISVNSSSGAITVHRIACVIDPGQAIHPDAVKAQIEGAVAQAVAATLYAQQTFVNGVPQVKNFSRYRMLRLSEMPQVDVQIINSGNPLGGVGEPGVPCVAPAIANAYARLMGASNRRRALPFFPGSTLGGL